MKFNVIMSLSVVLFLAGCNLNSNSLKFELPGEAARPNGELRLSKEQNEVVQAGVKEVIPNPASARFGVPKALKVQSQKDIQVCGYVQYKKEDGAFSEDTLYYMALKDAPAKPEVIRGQVGIDSSKLSIVKFMCRRHL